MGLTDFHPITTSILILIIFTVCSAAFYPVVRTLTGGRNHVTGEQDPDRILIDWTISFALSTIVFGTLDAWLCWMAGFHEIIQMIVVLFWLAAGFVGGRILLSDWRRTPRTELVKTILVILLIFSPFILFMVPSVSTPYIYGDDHNYHVSIIRYWFQGNSYQSAGTSAFFCTPLLGSQQAAIFFPLFGLITAKYLQFFFMFFGSLFTFAILNHRKKWVILSATGAILFINLPFHFFAAFYAKADRSSAFYILVGIGILFYEKLGWRHILWIALTLLTGAIASKTTYLPVFISGIGSIVAWLMLKKYTGLLLEKKIIVQNVLIVFTSALILLPWYGRAFIETGNPFYPQSIMSDEFSGENNFYADLLSYPKNYKYKKTFRNILDATWRNNNPSNNSSNPLIWISLPFAILGFLKRRYHKLHHEETAIIILVVLNTLISCYVHFIVHFRYWFYPVYGLIIILLFSGIGSLSGKWIKSAIGVILLSSILSLWPQRLALRNYCNASMPYFLGKESMWQNLARRHIFRDDMIMLRDNISEDSNVAITKTLMSIYTPGTIFLTKYIHDYFTTEKALDRIESHISSVDSIYDWMQLNDLDAFVVFPPDLIDPDILNAKNSRLKMIAGEKLILIKKLLQKQRETEAQ